MGGSKSKSSSKPVDMTPGAFQNLQQPFADVIGNLLGQYVPQGTKAIMQGYQGPLTTPASGGETNALNQVGQLAGNIGQTGAQAPGGTQPGAPGSVNPSDPNYLQQATQNTMQPFQQYGGPSQASQSLMNSTALSGGSAQAANQFVQGLGIGGPPQQSLGDFNTGLQGSSQTGAFGGDPNNPFLQQYIQAAQRPTQQALEETLSRTLPGRFTQAGHLVQPGGSSAFDRAAAIATRGAADALGDIGTNISYNALEAARGREAGALENELARRGQFGLQTQGLNAQAMQSQLDRAQQIPGLESQIANQNAQTNLTLGQLGGQSAQNALTLAQARAAEAGRGLTNAQTGTQNAQTGLTQSQITSNDMNTAIQNLQAQSLPRLIQDMGVERGIESFNNQVNALLSTLGIASGVTRPVVSQESKSSSGSFNIK